VGVREGSEPVALALGVPLALAPRLRLAVREVVALGEAPRDRLPVALAEGVAVGL
jgi:hypothetical protein